jgi:hypothetical protein
MTEKWKREKIHHFLRTTPLCKANGKETQEEARVNDWKHNKTEI